MTAPILRNRIRNGSMVMFEIAFGFGALMLLQLRRVGDFRRESRDYLRIDTDHYTYLIPLAV